MDVEFDKENGRSSSPSRCCGSANWNTQLQHNMIISHGANPPNNQPLHSASAHQTVSTTVDKSKKWWKRPPYMNGTEN
jgi:hypothetical protein